MLERTHDHPAHSRIIGNVPAGGVGFNARMDACSARPERRWAGAFAPPRAQSRRGCAFESSRIKDAIVEAANSLLPYG